MKKVLVVLLTALLVLTMGASVVFADEDPITPDCIGEECIAPCIFICAEPECVDAD